MRALVGDIGGTKTDLAVYEGSPGAAPRVVVEARFASAEHAALLDIVRRMLGEQRVDVVVLAVAGPVVEGRSNITNLPWVLDALELERELSTPVELLNDFAVLPLAIPHLRPSDLVCLAPGVPDPRGPIAVLGAGTGLGEAIAVRVDERIVVLPTEGGHADFAPLDEAQVRLWRHLHARHGHVSVERVVSGPGLAAVYEALAFEAGETISVALEPADVTERALAGGDALCERALSMWLAMYGAEAGNFALKTLPTAGLYLAGGIAPRLIERMRRGGELLDAFLAKGRMRDVLERIPVHVITHPRVALLGAWARCCVIYNVK